MTATITTLAEVVVMVDRIAVGVATFLCAILVCDVVDVQTKK